MHSYVVEGHNALPTVEGVSHVLLIGAFAGHTNPLRVLFTQAFRCLVPYMTPDERATLAGAPPDGTDTAPRQGITEDALFTSWAWAVETGGPRPACSEDVAALFTSILDGTLAFRRPTGPSAMAPSGQQSPPQAAALAAEPLAPWWRRALAHLASCLSLPASVP